MIKIEVKPQQILSNHSTVLTLYITNAGDGHCTGFRFSFYSTEAIVILEGRNIVIDLLKAGIVYEHKIRLLAKRPGTFIVESVGLVYRTSQGKLHRPGNYRLTLEVIGHSIPELDLSIQNTNLAIAQWGRITGYINNQGNDTVQDIHLTVQGHEVSCREEIILDIQPGESKPFSLTVQPGEAGEHVPMELEIMYQDSIGKIYRQKWPIHLSVQATPSSLHNNHTTHFHGTVSGTIHTGPGNIEDA